MTDKNVKPVVGVITGRNGTFDIVDIDVWFANGAERVWIDGIGKSGKVINGGIGVETSLFIKKVSPIIEAMGFQIIPK
jgi:hypothetical protein